LRYDDVVLASPKDGYPARTPGAVVHAYSGVDEYTVELSGENGD
jgi:hypothetical protein